MPALLNYTAFVDYFEHTDKSVLDHVLLSPRKVFSGVKVHTEAESGLYDASSTYRRDQWHQQFDKSSNLPHRGDAYHVQFSSELDDNTIVMFKTQRERQIDIGRDYSYEPLGVGECRIVEDNDSARGITDGEIIFIRQGPVNLLPFVEEYEKENKELHDGQ